MIAHGFGCISLMINDVKHLFMGLLAIYMSFYIFIFWEIAIQVLGSFCNRTIPFLKIVLLLTCGSFLLFWKLTPHQVYGLQIFLPFQGLPFHSVDAFTYCAEALSLAVVPPAWFCFCCLYFAHAVHWCPARPGNFLLGKWKVLSSTNGAGNIG